MQRSLRTSTLLFLLASPSFAQRDDMKSASQFTTQWVTSDDWSKDVTLSVDEIDTGAEVFHIRLLYLDDPEFSLREPEFRIFPG